MKASRHSLLALLVVSALGCGGGGGDRKSSSGTTSALTFSAATGTNALTTPFGSGAEVAYNTSADSTDVTLFTTGSTERSLVFDVAGPVAVGQAFTLGGEVNVAALNYFQAVGDSTQSWGATAGTATVTAKTDTTITVTLANATFVPLGEAGDTATGTFTIDGTLEKR